MHYVTRGWHWTWDLALLPYSTWPPSASTGACTAATLTMPHPAQFMSVSETVLAVTVTVTS